MRAVHSEECGHFELLVTYTTQFFYFTSSLSTKSEHVCGNFKKSIYHSFSPSVLLLLFLSTSISIAAGESKDLKRAFYKAVKKIYHVHVVTQFQAHDDDNVLMAHH